MILTESQIQNYCLAEIQMLLNKNGKALSNFPDMPQPDPSLLTQLDNHLIREELNYNIQEMKTIHDSLYKCLNPEQLKVYESVIRAINEQLVGLFFVYRPGGTGETFLYNTILTKLRSERLIVLAVASSCIASLLLPSSRTAHNRFVIPLELLENSTCGIKQNTHLAALLYEVRLIIWDEAPMTQKYAFEALDKTLRDILGTKDHQNRGKIFGGLPILNGGDFRQILPVIPKDIGDGKLPAQVREGEDEPTWIQIPQEFLLTPDPTPIESIVDAIFPEFNLNQTDDDYFRQCAILTPRNDDVAEINKHIFKRLTGVPPHKLKLKIGQPVMLLRNINLSAVETWRYSVSPLLYLVRDDYLSGCDWHSAHASLGADLHVISFGIRTIGLLECDGHSVHAYPRGILTECDVHSARAFLEGPDIKHVDDTFKNFKVIYNTTARLK
ncbi:uncharacterized protein [Rutidosis leptorrhynchoides]|uniref:uncharacterized protein n=1 Tax=Rutidosis leptorrhynchoides TaxID=125765 RepID=UPI003A99E7FF